MICVLFVKKLFFHLSVFERVWSTLLKFYASSTLQRNGNNHCNGYLGHPFKNMHFENDNEPSSTACKQRKVSVKSGVVDLILMLEQRPAHFEVIRAGDVHRKAIDERAEEVFAERGQCLSATADFVCRGQS